ncbi:transposase [Ornithinibacillus halotolerans]|uniref:Transposase IS200-like domain-containing protein n=1 Tax=Ornithinibacillus halotolerans TaxID=1274357 RepID=A0A916S3B6_9BACI|nr:transposase [Ornithinibacillus halotolerans]GGA79115.1 hypothetical protein GCM10008025_23200 [Ornithinibacillus halotolerans]
MWSSHAFYHIVSRGNRRGALFLEKGDFQAFLYLLEKVNEKTPFELASYCLMNNHYHLQLRSKNHSISKIMALINKRYADYYNKKYDLTGHVFENRFYGEIIEPGSGMLQVSSYIHLNPVRANLVNKPEHYPWSSYQYYVNPIRHELLVLDEVLAYFPGSDHNKRKKYGEYIQLEQERKESKSS